MGQGATGAAAPLNAAIHGANRMTMSWVASSRRITAVNLQLAIGFRFAPGGTAVSTKSSAGGHSSFPRYNDRLKVKCRSGIRLRGESEIQRSTPSLRSA
jgi:hypothetical protein